MIIADFIRLREEADVNVKRETLVQANDVRTNYDAARRLRTLNVTRDEATSLESISQRLLENFNSIRSDIILATGTLPKEHHLDAMDSLTKIANSPKVDLVEVRKIADMLSFVVIPFEYLDRRAYQNESHEMVGAISGFVKAMAPTFAPYVLCPVAYYSISNHVNAKDDEPIYAPSNAVQAFMAISMSVPMFRSMLNEMRSLRGEVRGIEERIAKAEQELVNLSKRVEQLAAQVDMQQRAIIEQQMRTAKLENDLAAARSFSALEPMLIGIPKKKSVFDDTWSVVGPCWGPDFPDIVATAFKLKAVKDQRKMIAVKAAAYAAYSSIGNTSRRYY